MISHLVKLFNKPVSLLVITFAVGLAGCDSGGSSAPAPAPDLTPEPDLVIETQSITGGGVKGPLANAVVTVYAFDSAQAGFKGSAVGTGSTDASAAITGLGLPFPLNPPYIMEFTSTAGTTTDITTGAFPVITTMRTVITQASLDSGEQIYATPLTTMAVDIAVNDAGASATSAQFETALTAAASQVVSTLGFGMDGSVDIFDVPPLIDNTTTGTADQAAVAAYRTAVEAVTAIAYEISQQSAGASTDTVLGDLAADLADGGVIDGSAGTTLDTNTLQVLEQDPALLTIPNTAQTVADVQTILATETATTGSTTTTTELTDGSITTESAPAETNPDIDGDGVLNADDAFPENAAETVDTDGDGIGDNADPDDDNNGVLDVDEGTTPVITGTDTDGDGVLDTAPDNCINNINPAQTNTDGDAEGDACDTDDDNDSTLDINDAFPLDAGETTDTDSDGTGDVADADDDNDGVLDGSDTGFAPVGAPFEGVACSLLTDCDGDGVLDGADFNPVDASVTFNFAPVTANGSVATDEDVATPVVLDVTDDGVAVGPLVYAITGPSNGVLSGVEPNLTYTPNAEFNGSDSFTFTATDADSKVSNIATVSITVNAVNDTPVVGAAGPFSLAENAVNSTVVGTVNATDADGVDAVTGYTITAGNAGTAFAIDASGQITVADTNAINFETITSYSLSITATDGVNTSVAEVVTVNITDVNDTAPVVGTAGPFSIAEDASNASVVGTVTAIDVDTVGAVTGYTITVGNTGNAFAISAAGQITVADTAAIDFESATSFSLSITATDGVNTSAVEVVTINITDVNDTAPVVGAAGPFSIAEDAANATVVGTVIATDADGVGAVTGYTITVGNTGVAFAISAAGQITVADTTAIDYESATSFNLSITATDGTNTSVVEIVTVNITDVNDTAPVVGAAGPFSIAEDISNAAVVGNVVATDVDTVGAVTAYTITAGNTGNAFAIDTSGQITVADTTAINFETITSYSLSITATDGINTSVAEVVTVNITDANDTAPVVGAVGPFSIAEDAANTTVVGSVTATDVDTVGSVTAYTIAAGNTGNAFAISTAGQITVADTTVINFETITSYSLSITATDGINTSVAEVVTVNITDVNDTAPVVGAAGPFSIAEDAANASVVGTVIASDADGVGAVTGYTITAGNTGVAFAISAAGQITVADTTAIDYESAISFNLSITATDGTNTSVVEIVTVNITDVNDTAPIVAPGQSFNLIDTAVNGAVVGTISASDADTVGSITDFTITGTVFTIAANGQITVIDAASLGADGTVHSLTVDATDGINTSASENVTITVVTNAPPVIAQTGPLAVTMDEDSLPVAFVAPTITATDAELDPLTWSTPGATNGIATVSGTGASPTITYVPNTNFNGGDSFIVNVNDGISTVGITVNITVDPINDVPSVGVDTGTTEEDLAFTTVNVLTNDTDIENDTLSILSADISSNMGGVVTNNSDGTFEYSPPANFNGEDYFSYLVTDGTDGNTGFVNITVTPVNDAPVAVDDPETTVVNTVLITANVLGNDSDVEGDTLSVVAGDPAAANGTVVNSGNGIFTYTPNTDFEGSDSFTYTVSDGALTAVGTVNVTVTPPGTPIAMTTLMDATNGGVAGFEMDGPTDFGYWTDNFDSVTGVFGFNDYEYNYTSGAFQLSAGDDDLIWNGTAWVAEDHIVGTDDGVGGLNLSIRDVSDNEVSSYNLTAKYIDITGELIVNHLGYPEWQAAMSNQSAVFSSGAKLISEYRFEALSESYWLWNGDWCLDNGTQYSDLNGNCNSIYVGTTATGYAETLAQVVEATAWVDNDDDSTPSGATAWVAGNDANNTNLQVQLVTGNVANYYMIDWNTSVPADRTVLVATSTWTQDASSGVDMIHYEVPAEAAVLFSDDLNEGLNFFLTVQNGFVRQGDKDIVGSAGFEKGMLNGVAKDDVLANFDAIQSLGYNFTDVTLGTGYDLYYDAAVPTWCIDSYNFYGDGTYDGYDHVVCSGTASGWSGTYSINATTGVMTIVDGLDTFYRKVIGFNPTYGAKETCGSLDEAGPFNCVEGDEFFGYEFIDSTAAENAMNSLNGGAASLDCSYESTPWGVQLDSYTDFETVVAACGGVLTTTNADVEGTWTDTWLEGADEWSEIVVFDVGGTGTGTFTETLNGVVQSTAVFTWSITNDLLTITDSITFVDTWAMTTSGLKVYTEDDSMSSDKILDGIADGGIWTGNYIKEGAATLACGYESGWDDVLSAPINPNSFTEYETVLTGCNSIDHGYEAQALTAAEVQALVTNQGLEVTTFNLLGAAVGTEADPGTGVYDDGAGFVININWWVEAATCSGCTHNYVVVYTDTIIEPNLATLVAPGFWMRETSSVIAVVDNDLSGAPTAGDEMQFYKYGEQQNYSDTDRATGSDGEIFISVGNIIQ